MEDLEDLESISDFIHNDGTVAATSSARFSLSGRTDSGYQSLVPATGPDHTTGVCHLRGLVELVKWGKEQVFDDVPSAMTITFNCLSTEGPKQLLIDHVAFCHPSTGAPIDLRAALLLDFNQAPSQNSFARTQWAGATFGPHPTPSSLAPSFSRTFKYSIPLILSSNDRTHAQDARSRAEVELVHHITAEPLEGPPFNTGDTATIGYKSYIKSMWQDPDGDGAWLGRTEISDALWVLAGGKLRHTLVALPDTGCIWYDDGSVVEGEVFEEVFLDIHRLEMVSD